MAKPYVSTDKPFGRNKELSNDFTMLDQAGKAISSARRDASRPTPKKGDQGGPKKVTSPPLSV